MIYPGSRYANADISSVQVDASTFGPFVVPALVQPLGITFQRYITVEGDRFDTLAAAMYSDPLKWWVIADMNPEVLFPADIPAGTVIRLPLAV